MRLGVLTKRQAEWKKRLQEGLVRNTSFNVRVCARYWLFAYGLPGMGPREGGGVLNKVFTGRLRPEVQPLKPL